MIGDPRSRSMVEALTLTGGRLTSPNPNDTRDGHSIIIIVIIKDPEWKLLN